VRRVADAAGEDAGVVPFVVVSRGSSSAAREGKGRSVFMSENSALFLKGPYAAVGTINAAIVAMAEAFSDRGVADGVQVNSVLPCLS